MINLHREFKTAEECLKDVNGIIALYRHSHSVFSLAMEVNSEGARYYLNLEEKQKDAA